MTILVTILIALTGYKFVVYELIYYLTKKCKRIVDARLTDGTEIENGRYKYKAAFVYNGKEKVVDYTPPYQQGLSLDKRYYYVPYTNVLFRVSDYIDYLRKVNYLRLVFYSLFTLLFALILALKGWGFIGINVIITLMGFRFLLYGLIDIAPDGDLYKVDGIVEENKSGRDAMMHVRVGNAGHTYVPKYRFYVNDKEYKVWGNTAYGPARQIGKSYKLKVYDDGTIYEGDAFKFILCVMGFLFFVIGLFSTIAMAVSLAL